MATYNGELFIREQINSILCQLDQYDELIISDDGSSDSTLSIVRSYKDNRIKLLLGNKFHSPVYNFENALKYANGDIIFLSDQDDIWKPHRVSSTLKVFQNRNIDCVLCNRDIIDAYGNILDTQHVKKNPVDKNFLSQLLRNPYIGCCMAFRKSLLEIALPFPEELPMHDLWIGLLGALSHKNLFIQDSLILYRRHNNNVTTGKSPYSILYRIKYRLKLYFQLINRIGKSRKD